MQTPNDLDKEAAITSTCLMVTQYTPLTDVQRNKKKYNKQK